LRREKKEVRLRILYRPESRKYATLRKKLTYTEFKYMPDKLTSPMWITIYKDKTLLFVVGDILLGIVIENKAISDNFKEYFELIWGLSKS